MDSQNERRAGVEEIEMNLAVEAEFTRDGRGGRKSSPNLCRKFTGNLEI
jgi:hypothetical protein